MNRFIFGRGWVVQDETNGDGGDAGGGGAAAEETGGEEGNAAGAEGGEAAAAAEPAKKPAAEGEPKDMLEAITKGLEKTAPKVDEDAAAKTATEEAAAAAAKAEKHANGQPKKDAQGNELDEKGAIVKKAAPAKLKTAAELDLTPVEKKALNTKTGARFGEVLTTLKAREAEVATLTEQMKPLQEARDTITSILAETNTTPDQLSAYLEFNRMLQSDDPKELESALHLIEAQRTALYKALGKEPADGGVDLLADFPDLKEKVAEAQMTRDAALEVAQARRERAAAEARTQLETQQQNSQQQKQQASEKALTDITTWTVDLAKRDIDYKAKETRLLEQVDEVIKNYPPNQWLSTLKLLYAGIQVQKAAPAPRKGEQPIRPSGAKPGAKAPQNMFEAMWGSEAPK